MSGWNTLGGWTNLLLGKFLTTSTEVQTDFSPPICSGAKTEFMKNEQDSRKWKSTEAEKQPFPNKELYLKLGPKNVFIFDSTIENRIKEESFLQALYIFQDCTGSHF